MRIIYLIFLIIIGLFTSCYKVFDPQVNSKEKVLVVDGLMTNQTDVYHVVLTYARLFNSTKKSTPTYCWYNNDKTTYKNKYGALYNWYTVSTN